MIARTLVRNEGIKTLRRPAFWVGVAGFFTLISLSFIGDYVQRVRQDEPLRTLPDAWGWVIGDLGPVAMLFAGVVLMLLVASEFSWRTARQNVIDGLSKERWFAGKLMLVPVLALGFVALQLLIGGTVALFATYQTGEPGSLIGAIDLAHMGGTLLAALVFSSLAFLSAMLFRGTGAAIGVFFLYIAVVENLITGLSRAADSDIARYTPQNVASRLGSRGLWAPDPDAAGAAEPTLFILIACGWIVLFIGGAFADFMRRDL